MPFKFEDDGVHKKHETEQTEEIIIFSKENCSYCLYVKKLFDELNLEYTEFTLGEHFAKADHYKKFGMNATFPKVEVDEEVIGGARDTVVWLKKARYLPGH